MKQLSSRFHAVFDQRVHEDPQLTQSGEYHEALMQLLLLETSCFRYWGQGSWTDYAKEIHRRGNAALTEPALQECDNNVAARTNR